MKTPDTDIETIILRLDRLEAFLQQDPDNPFLLADAFDTALHAAQWERAHRILRLGFATGKNPEAWRLRDANWLMAQQRWEEAQHKLRTLAAETAHHSGDAGLAQAAACGLAQIAFQQGDYAQCRLLLARWTESEASRTPPEMQALWLRCMHRLGQVDEAIAWAARIWKANALAPLAAGIASLAALDAADYAACRQWAEFALAEMPQQREALVARGSLALAQRDAAGARRLLAAVVEHDPTEGRAWSALGFTALLENDLLRARSDFALAVQHMPAHVGTWHGLGWTALLQHELPAAHDAFERALALDRNVAESYGALAVTLALSKQPSLAMQAVERAMHLDRNNLSARYAQALLSGEVSDAGSLTRLARRLLGDMAAPLGDRLIDWMPQPAQSIRP